MPSDGVSLEKWLDRGINVVKVVWVLAEIATTAAVSYGLYISDSNQSCVNAVCGQQTTPSTIGWGIGLFVVVCFWVVVAGLRRYKRQLRAGISPRAEPQQGGLLHWLYDWFDGKF